MKLARVTLWGLHALPFLMPLSGPAAWFGGAERAAEGYEVTRVILPALIARHLAGALAHGFAFRGGVVERMPRPAR